jgi:hypothetical protein
MKFMRDYNAINQTNKLGAKEDTNIPQVLAGYFAAVFP